MRDRLGEAACSVVASGVQGETGDIEAACSAADRASESSPWSRIRPTQRGKLVLKLTDGLQAYAGEASEVESFDTAKPIRNAPCVDIQVSCELLRCLITSRAEITGQSKQFGLERELSYEAIALCNETKADASLL